MADSVNTPACMAGTRRVFFTAAALQIVDSFVTAAANRHAATQRVEPSGQYRSAATPLLELAAQDAVVSLALGATRASCRARSRTKATRSRFTVSPISRDDRRHDRIARDLARLAPCVERANVIGDRDRFTGREHREMRRDLVGVGASLVHY